MVVLDTDVLICLSKGNKEIVDKIKVLEENETLSTTIFNYEEYLFGLMNLNKPEAMAQGKLLLSKLNVYDYTLEEVEKVVETKILQKKQGQTLGKYDEAIAGICLAKNEALYTLNRKHFNKIKELKTI